MQFKHCLSFLLLVKISILLINNQTNAIQVRVSNLTIGQEVKNVSISSNLEDIYRIVYNSSNTTLNVFASTDATVDLPLLIVIRQEKGLLSLQLPNKETGRTVQNVSRTLCPAYVSRDSHGLSTLYIDMYTSSSINITYSLKVSYFSSFILTENKKITQTVSPFAPVFFKYDIQSESSLVKFTSPDRICTTVSVQRMMCPVFDLKHTVDFAGQYQTMTSLAAISVDNSNFVYKSMYVVVSVHPTDRECCDTRNCSEASGHRIKNITIELQPGYDHSNVNLSYAITLSVFLAIYVVICPFLCFVEPYSEKNLKTLIDEYKLNETTFTTSSAVTPTSTSRIYDFSEPSLQIKIERSNDFKKVSKTNVKSNEKLLAIQSINNPIVHHYVNQYKKNPNFIKKQTSRIENQISVSSDPTSATPQNPTNSEYLQDDNTINEDNSFSSSEYDKVEDAEAYKEVVRNKPNLKVHDLARKQPKLLDRKIMNYPRLIIAIATFYVLPVFQLVLLHQTQLTKSGNEDSCFFNFLCMIKSGPFAAFNNIFSNVGYILLGIMFIIVVKKRSYSYTYMRKKYPYIMSTHGVPQHFGLFYTMGIGLVMEGILSAAYHVCPSFNNFQFDTSFMYITGVISTIKLYQCRHPDIHPSSQKVFLFLALCILLNVIGVFYGKINTWFVISYTIGHVVVFFILSIIIYYMKQPKLGMSTFKIMAQKFKQEKNLTQPVHIDRLVMLIIANVFNVGAAIYANLVPMQFSSYLLIVLLGNFNIYFFMYLLNKIINREQFHFITVINLIVTTIAWIAAMYFYNIEIKQWEKKPAESRESNKSCILLNVYDHHDAWHFLSALSMFMTFVVILTLDDGIISKKRNEISMVSLENTRNAKGGFTFEQIINSNEDYTDQPQVSFVSSNDNIPLTSEAEPNFKQIKTTFVIIAHIFMCILFLISAYVIPLIFEKKSDIFSKFQPIDIVLFIHAFYWVVFYIFDRVYQFHHMKSRRNGYLEFYRSTRLIRSLPLITISAGNAMIIVLLRVFDKYCSNSCTSANLTPLSFIQIFTSVEFGMVLLILFKYLYMTIRFNRSKKMPDINQELERPVFSASQIHDLGYKDSSYLSTILENQADMIRYLQEKNDTLTHKLYQQSQKSNLANIN
ncbi:unnamed protein product [Brachionus calyciflorus]|uniref:Uncharacterized protein n=1 Tax=Brachionus calyciflorus TaxID=104777 RepID=A0A813PT45_9BILA|nr:unnamed protein product [Brachionus calyciflorus]